MDRNQLPATLYHVWLWIPGGNKKSFCKGLK